jgi:hypothetical protein
MKKRKHINLVGAGSGQGKIGGGKTRKGGRKAPTLAKPGGGGRGGGRP